MKKGDVVILGLAVLIFASACFLLLSGGDTDSVLVRVRTPQQTFLYNLSENRVVEVEGLNGRSVIEIQDGVVRFLESDCPNHTCRMSSISRGGEYVACLPNGVLVSIEGSSDWGVDDVAF